MFPGRYSRYRHYFFNTTQQGDCPAPRAISVLFPVY
jgi:hypothetical protein